MTAGLVCAPHGRGHRHCVHVLAPGRRCHEPGGCGDDCRAGIRGWRCAKHGYTWEHCPHGEDRCRHGYPAGVIPVPGHRHRLGGPALLRHPPGRRGPPVPRGRRASRTRGTARTFRQGAAPRHGRRSPRPWRHDRAVHRCAPPVPDGATARATVTCSPGRPPDGARTRHRRQDKPMSYPQPTYPRPAARPGAAGPSGTCPRLWPSLPPRSSSAGQPPDTSPISTGRRCSQARSGDISVAAAARRRRSRGRRHRACLLAASPHAGPPGRTLLLCPLGRRAARRLARTIGGRLGGSSALGCAVVALPPAGLFLYRSYRAGVQVTAPMRARVVKRAC